MNEQTYKKDTKSCFERFYLNILWSIFKSKHVHKRIVELSSQAKLAIQDVKATEFELVL